MRAVSVRLWAAVLAAAVLLPLLPGAAAAQSSFSEFNDIGGHWSEAFVRTLLYAGVLTVPEDGRFRPDEPVTRLDFTLWMAGAMELAAAPEPSTPPFADWNEIPEEARGKVLAAVQAGLIQGFPDGSFRPAERLNRAQMGVIFGRALIPLGFAPEDRYRHTFLDGDQIPDWAFEATAAIKARVILGTWKNGQILYAPFDETTRAEAVTMIARFVEIRIEKLGIERPEPSRLTAALARLVYYIDTDDGYGSLLKHGDAVDGLVFWSYHLEQTEDGFRLAGSDRVRVLSWASETGKPLIALIASHDRTANDAFLADTAAQERFVRELEGLLDKGYSGVNLDFEYVSASRRDAFTQFVRRVAAAMKARGAHVSLSVPAKRGENLSDNWIGAYDYAALGGLVDYVAVMTYDQHWRGGPAGPVGSLSWMRDVLDYAVQHIPREKILLGLPAYGYDWPAGGGTGRALTARQAEELAASVGVRPAFDAASAEATFTYTAEDGQGRIVWYTSPQGVLLKAALVAEYRLGGFVMWRMGQEVDGYWTSFAEALQ